MPCKKPFVRGVVEFGCGQCLGCRIVKKKTWKHRIILETKKHVENSFLTLTYSDEHLPQGGSLEPKDATNFLKKLRKNLDREGETRIRYYLVGEYGDQSERPHYHLAVFGIGCRGINPRYTQGKDCQCKICSIVRKSWIFGFVAVGTLENDSASYIAGYVQKSVKIDGKTIMGLTNINDPLVKKWLKGRHPEYARMSRRPGIGGDAISNVVDTLTSYYGSDYIKKNGDVPLTLNHGSQTYPLGRYLREKIRKEYGFTKRTSLRGTVTYSPEDSMLKLSQKNIEEQEAIHAKAKKIKKDPYQFEKEYKLQKVRNQEVHAEINTKGTRAI